jgi:hypothetical protein
MTSFHRSCNPIRSTANGPLAARRPGRRSANFRDSMDVRVATAPRHHTSRGYLTCPRKSPSPSIHGYNREKRTPPARDERPSEVVGVRMRSPRTGVRGRTERRRPPSSHTLLKESPPPGTNEKWPHAEYGRRAGPGRKATWNPWRRPSTTTTILGIPPPPGENYSFAPRRETIALYPRMDAPPRPSFSPPPHRTDPPSSPPGRGVVRRFVPPEDEPARRPFPPNRERAANKRHDVVDAKHPTVACREGLPDLYIHGRRI